MDRRAEVGRRDRQRPHTHSCGFVHFSTYTYIYKYLYMNIYSRDLHAQTRRSERERERKARQRGIFSFSVPPSLKQEKNIYIYYYNNNHHRHHRQRPHHLQAFDAFGENSRPSRARKDGHFGRERPLEQDDSSLVSLDEVKHPMAHQSEQRHRLRPLEHLSFCEADRQKKISSQLNFFSRPHVQRVRRRAHRT